MKHAALVLIVSFLALGINSKAESPAQSAPLNLGAAVENEIAGGQSHAYQITLERDQFALLRLEQRGIDLAVELMGKDGKVIIRYDDEIRHEGSEEISFVAETAGPATIVVRPRLKNAPPGRYELRFPETRAATDGERTLYQARKLRTQASELHEQGKDREALPLIEQARAQAEKVLGREDALTAQLLKEEADYHFAQADYPEAKSIYAQAEEIFAKTLGPEHLQTALTLRGRGAVSAMQGADPEANQYLLRALAIEEKELGPEHPQLADCLLSLGWITVNRGEAEAGEAHYLRALSILEKADQAETATYAHLLSNRAQLYHKRRDYLGADQLLQRAIAIYEKLYGPDHLRLAAVLQNRGISAMAAEDFAKAEESYRRALAIREKILGPEHVDVAFLLNSLAVLHRTRGDYGKALELIHRALPIMEKKAGPYQMARLVILTTIARLYALTEDWPNAVKYQTELETFNERSLALNLALGSERQKLAYLESIQLRTDRAISLCLQLAPENPEANALAALVVLQRKGRVLDAMADSLALLRARADAPGRALLDRLNETRKDLAALALGGPQKSPSKRDDRAAIAALEEKRERLEAEISARSAEFRSQNQPVTLVDVQAAIPERAALIEFIVYRPFDPKISSDRDSLGEPRYGAFVIKRAGAPAGVDLGSAKEMNAAVNALRQALRDPKRDPHDAARALDDKLMRPVRARLTGETRLLVSPDGDLNLLPFEALVDEKDSYLVQRYSFTYLTSGRDLLRLKIAREDAGRSLLVANPRFGHAAGESPSDSARKPSVTLTRSISDTYFAPLPGTLREVQSIQALFPEALFLSGPAATEAALKQAQAPRILHVATHGFFLSEPPADPKEPPQNPLLRSGLALANANAHEENAPTDDGILTALEASGLDLWGTRLVVLSACDTGLGEVKNGEGVYGLRRALFLAGAESMVMSLWPVGDASTRRLMADYYKNLKAGLGRGESLRHVQLDLLERDPKLHPFYWANFIQSGAWTGLDGKR